MDAIIVAIVFFLCMFVFVVASLIFVYLITRKSYTLSSGIAIHVHLGDKFKKEVLEKSISNIDAATNEYMRKLFELDIVNETVHKKAIEHLKYVRCYLIEPREGKWPSLEDKYYLERNKFPREEKLKEMIEKGFYDPETKKFYANGLTHSPKRIEVVWHGRIKNSAYLHELQHALIWVLYNYDSSFSHDTVMFRRFNEALKIVRGKY